MNMSEAGLGAGGTPNGYSKKTPIKDFIDGLLKRPKENKQEEALGEWLENNPETYRDEYAALQTVYAYAGHLLVAETDSAHPQRETSSYVSERASHSLWTPDDYGQLVLRVGQIEPPGEFITHVANQFSPEITPDYPVKGAELRILLGVECLKLEGNWEFHSGYNAPTSIYPSEMLKAVEASFARGSMPDSVADTSPPTLQILHGEGTQN